MVARTRHWLRDVVPYSQVTRRRTVVEDNARRTVVVGHSVHETDDVASTVVVVAALVGRTTAEVEAEAEVVVEVEVEAEAEVVVEVEVEAEAEVEIAKPSAQAQWAIFDSNDGYFCADDGDGVEFAGMAVAGDSRVVVGRGLSHHCSLFDVSHCPGLCFEYHG
jgi:hypothetical protein